MAHIVVLQVCHGSDVFSDGKDIDHYLVMMEGDAERELDGPYASDARRVQAAQTYRVRNGDRDGLYRLDIPKGIDVSLSEFAGAEVNNGVQDELTNFVISEIVEGGCPIRRSKVAGGEPHAVVVNCDQVMVKNDLASGPRNWRCRMRSR